MVTEENNEKNAIDNFEKANYSNTIDASILAEAIENYNKDEIQLNLFRNYMSGIEQRINNLNGTVADVLQNAQKNNTALLQILSDIESLKNGDA